MHFVAGKSPTKKQFLLNIDEKINNEEFINDTAYILRDAEAYDPHLACDLIRKEILERL